MLRAPIDGTLTLDELRDWANLVLFNDAFDFEGEDIRDVLDRIEESDEARIDQVTDQVTQQVNDQLTQQDTQQVTQQVRLLLKVLGDDELSLKELMVRLSLADRNNFTRNYLNPRSRRAS